MEKIDYGLNFRFRRNDRIGEAAAEVDDDFLFDCFVDNGDAGTLADSRSSKRIIVGRTGAGKSALLRVIEQRHQRVIRLSPDDLALNYLGNSEVIRFFEDAGANLDLFYQMLWRHVFTVELLKYKYKITNENQQESFLQRMGQIFARDRAKQQAIDYIRAWGKEFWNETEYRVKEITNKLETDLNAEFEGDALGSKIKIGGAEKLSLDEKQEIITRGNHVVNQIQIKALADVIKLLKDEVFDDAKDTHLIIIDDLDQRWVDDGLKYKLVRALIETIKWFRQLENVKIIVALRQDLLHRTMEATRDSGFQSEKYESLYLKLRWSKQQIIEIVDKRLARLVRQRYTTKSLGVAELFPSKISGVSCPDYITNLTFLRPRDAIIFVNECIDRSADKGQISTSTINEAEGTYSQKRLLSLQEEWGYVYPRASDYLKVFARRPYTQKFSEFSEESIRSWLTDVLLSKDSPDDPIYQLAQQWQIESKISHFKFLTSLMNALYTIGAVGIKPDKSTMYWSFYSDYTPNEADIRPTSTIELHMAFWRAVGART